MKILILGDTHFSNNLPMSKYEDVIGGKLSHRLKLQSEVFEKTVTRNEDTTIIHLGDLFHSSKIDLFTTIFVSDVINDIVFNKNHHNNFYILGGNHDYAGYDRFFSELIEKNDRIHIGDFDSINQDNKNVCFYGLSYYPLKVYKEKLDLIKQNLDESKINILFTHQNIENFYINGIDIGGVPMIEFKKFDKVFNGHYHEPQEKENITNVGSLYPLTFGDSNYRRVIEFDTNTMDIKEEKVQSWEMETVKSEKDINLTECQKFIRLIVDNTKYNPQKKQEIEKQLSLDNCLGIQWETLLNDNEEITDSKNDFILDMKNILSQYVKNTANKEQVKELIDVGLDILNEIR
jgi:predicted phosphodiesterase